MAGTGGGAARPVLGFSNALAIEQTPVGDLKGRTLDRTSPTGLGWPILCYADNAVLAARSSLADNPWAAIEGHRR